MRVHVPVQQQPYVVVLCSACELLQDAFCVPGLRLPGVFLWYLPTHVVCKGLVSRCDKFPVVGSSLLVGVSGTTLNACIWLQCNFVG